MFKKAFLTSLTLALLLVEGALPAWAGPGALTPVGIGRGSLGPVVVHPSSPGQAWIGLPGGGIDRTGNRGGSWSWAGRGLGDWTVEAVAADPSGPGALWAATRTGLFHTGDGGGHWRRLTNDAYTAALGDVSPRTVAAVGGAIFVHSYQRLLATRDGGLSWEVSFEAADGDALLVFGGGPAGLFLATSGVSGVGLLRSLDGGLTWASAPGGWEDALGISQIEVTPAGVYVRADRDGVSWLQRSVDGGATWQRLLGGAGGVGDVGGVGPVAVDARQPRTLWAQAGTRLWVSRDGGTTWRRRAPAPSGTRLTVEPGTGVLYVSSFESVTRSLDGGRTWQVLLRTLDEESAPSRVSFEPGNPARMALVVGNRLSLSNDGARSWWMPDPNARLSDLDIDPADPNRMVGTAGSSLVTSTDGGRSWRRGASVFSYVDQIVRTGSRTLFVAGCGIYRSPDNGRTWRNTLPCNARYAPDTGRFLRKLAADPDDPETFYALTAQIRDFYPNYDTLHEWPSILWKSEDGGLTWSKIGQNVQAVAVAPSGGQVYILRGLDLLASSDGGRGWRTVARLPRAAYDLAVPEDDPDAFFALFDSGVLYGAGGGEWSQFRTDTAPNAGALSALVPHPTDPRTVFVTSHGAVFHLRVR